MTKELAETWERSELRGTSMRVFDVDIFEDGLARIFAKPWWSRLWTGVELLLASRPRFVCGTRWTLWVDT